MKNYYKTVTILGILYFLAILVFILITGKGTAGTGRDMDIIRLNDIAGDAGDHFGDLSVLEGRDYGVDYALLDTADNLIYSSYPVGDEKLSLAAAMKKGSLYSYVDVDGRVAGYVILKDDGHGIYKDLRLRLTVGFAVLGIILLIMACAFGSYINRNIVTPFRNMKDFAGSVAEGRLDAPLTMDRNNMFGVFSESFDIMREELDASRKRELALARRERELVASLSHDLKTPITGIKLICELLTAKLSKPEKSAPLDSEDLNEKIGNIYKKADQIDVLVSDLFSSAMEDLDELKVHCEDVSSEVIGEIVKKYDDRGLVSSGDIPGALIRIDVKRMSQVIGNIISNSYKYADTRIEAGYRLVDEYLEMNIRDHGPGVPEDEIGLITNKFYRGRQWESGGVEGSGLGLYIARMLREKMDGGLVASSKGEGLCITLMIPLS